MGRAVASFILGSDKLLVKRSRFAISTVEDSRIRIVSGVDLPKRNCSSVEE